MADMLVKLYDFELDYDILKKLSQEGIYVKRAIAPEAHVVTAWVREQFSQGWADECAVALGNMPSTCFVAYKDGKILGFACCEATSPDYFGPTGVLESERGKGVGKALLHACLNHQKSMGYGYAIIGGAGADAVTFYEKCCGASTIENSKPGIYKDMLR